MVVCSQVVRKRTLSLTNVLKPLFLEHQLPDTQGQVKVAFSQVNKKASVLRLGG